MGNSQGRSRFRRAFAIAVAGGLVATAAACGPSFQAVYEGDSRFERCYALDERADAPMAKKTECWRDWALHYTYGQTRDRVDYAVARYRALSRMPGAPTDEAMMAAAPGVGVTDPRVSAPAPTSAFAPPPNTMQVGDGGAQAPAWDPASTPTADTVTVPPPGSDCSVACDTTWKKCSGHCTGEACNACGSTYKKCMRGCFKDEPAKKSPAGAASSGAKTR
ncbi:MAG: hypothetical protein U0169_04130 [Polyangiaceae bacterium]